MLRNQAHEQQPDCPGMSADNRSARPESASLRLTHAAVMTKRLDHAVAFYTDVLGLSLRGIEDDPIRKGRRRAMLVDDEGREILEVIEMEELAHPSIPGRGGIHHIGFHLPKTEWHALRSRLDAKGHGYDERHGRLFVRDADGLVLEIEQS